MRFQRGENSMVRKELFHLKILRTCSEQCLEYCVFVVSNALKCYQCSSEDDPECMENFDTGNEERFLTSTECEVNAARYCIKTTGIFGGRLRGHFSMTGICCLVSSFSNFQQKNVRMFVVKT